MEIATKETALDALKLGPPVGSVWKHSKTGHLYTVVRLSILEATLEAAVTYRSHIDQVEWTRPLSSFRQTVCVGGLWVQRFEPARSAKAEMVIHDECAGGGCEACNMRGSVVKTTP